MTDPSRLLATVEAAARELPDVASVSGADSTTWSRGSTPFAVLRQSSIELRTGPEIAAAAVRTPDTGASRRGSDWIEFAPGELDGHALDRLEAWFAAAHRRAAG